jgi:AraC-like DNA-binding protein
VWRDGCAYWLADGLHRLAAAEKAAMIELLCEVHAGTLSDAEWDSYGPGRIGTLPFSLAEMRNFLAPALRHPHAAALSDVQIASHLGVATSFILYWKNRLCQQRAGSVPRIEGVTDEIVLKAVRYLRANLGSTLNVTKLARSIGVSPPHLRRRFRLAAQSSPQDVFTGLRMERARELLTGGDLSVKQIAAELGYKRSAAFGRVFVRFWGVPPAELRRCYHSSTPASRCTGEMDSEDTPDIHAGVRSA